MGGHGPGAEIRARGTGRQWGAIGGHDGRQRAARGGHDGRQHEAMAPEPKSARGEPEATGGQGLQRLEAMGGQSIWEEPGATGRDGRPRREATRGHGPGAGIRARGAEGKGGHRRPRCEATGGQCLGAEIRARGTGGNRRPQEATAPEPKSVRGELILKGKARTPRSKLCLGNKKKTCQHVPKNWI